MNDADPPAPPEPAAPVLSYARTRRDSYRRVNIVGAVASLLLLVVFYVGLAPSVSPFAFDYTRNIPLSEALGGVLRVPPSVVIGDVYTADKVWFMPTALAVMAGFLAVPWRWPKLSLAAGAVLLPLWFVAHVPGAWYVLPIMGVVVLPGAVAGRCDGETWSEGMVAYGAMGAWMTLWSLVAVALLIRIARARRTGHASDTGG